MVELIDSLRPTSIFAFDKAGDQVRASARLLSLANDRMGVVAWLRAFAAQAAQASMRVAAGRCAIRAGEGSALTTHGDAFIIGPMPL